MSEVPRTPRRVLPSGEQVELVDGDQRAVVVEVGGALRAYEVAGVEVLDGYGDEEMCSGARGQSLIPWPNRLRDGRYEFDGVSYQLPLSEPAKRNAIHGLIRWANWTVIDRAADRVTMEYVLHPQAGYPFALHLAISYELGNEGLAVTTTATNVGTTDCPYGAGAHPYLTLGTETIDALVLKAPGRIWLPEDERGIPTGSEPVDGTPYDFRQPRPLGEVELDTGYAELERDEDGRARVELRTPDGDRAVSLWLDESYPYLMLFTGDSLPEVERRRRGLGVEPMTCAPDAFESGKGLRRLAPGETFTSGWGITPHVDARWRRLGSDHERLDLPFRSRTTRPDSPTIPVRAEHATRRTSRVLRLQKASRMSISLEGMVLSRDWSMIFSRWAGRRWPGRVLLCRRGL